MAHTYVKINMPSMKEAMKGLGLDKTGKVQIEATRLARQYMDKHVPYREGNLKDEAIEKYDEIIYGPPGSESEPYARRMYFGIEYNFNEAPQRGAIWDERMLADSGEQFYRAIQEFVDKQKLD